MDLPLPANVVHGAEAGLRGRKNPDLPHSWGVFIKISQETSGPPFFQPMEQIHLYIGPHPHASSFCKKVVKYKTGLLLL